MALRTRGFRSSNLSERAILLLPLDDSPKTTRHSRHGEGAGQVAYHRVPQHDSASRAAGGRRQVDTQRSNCTRSADNSFRPKPLRRLTQFSYASQAFHFADWGSWSFPPVPGFCSLRSVARGWSGCSLEQTGDKAYPRFVVSSLSMQDFPAPRAVRGAGWTCAARRDVPQGVHYCIVYT